LGPLTNNVEEKVMANVMRIVRKVEVWIVGAFGGLILIACLDKPAEKAKPASRVSAVSEVELAQPAPGSTQPTYVVYVVGKRPSAAEKRAARGGAG
jgi:hypothetical protein